MSPEDKQGIKDTKTINKFSITPKFILWFLFITLAPLVLAIYISYSNSRQALQKEIAKNLFTIADSKARQIESYLQQKSNHVTELSHTADIIYALEKYNDAFRRGINSPEYINIDNRFRSFFVYHQRAGEFDDLFLISPDGEVTFSASEAMQAKSLYELALYKKDSQLAKIFIKAKESSQTEVSHFEYDPKAKEAAVYIAASVYKGADFLGLVITQFNSQRLARLVTDYTGLGETGEIFLAAKIADEAVIINPLRFDSQAAFKRTIPMNSKPQVPVQKALSGEDGNGFSVDYRQNKVFGVWRYLSPFDLGMVVKMDAKEIQLSANQLRNTLTKVTSGLLGIVVIVAILIARSISRPIKTLTKVSSTIAGGNLSARAQIKTNDEIGELAHSFNVMTDSLVAAKADVEKQKELLEKANKELDSFVYTASHDLRAPLRGIASFASFLKEDYMDKLDKEGQDHLNEIQKGANRLSQLIDDLLTLSRISRIQNPYEKVNATELINSIVERIKFDVKEHNVDLRIQQNMPVVYCDRIKIGEVFLNLINNAIKFSSRGNKQNPRVEVGYSEDGDMHKFYVKDNGIGIDPQYHEQVFGIFKRLHTDKEYSGTGAGLSIVKRIIDDHGGGIWIDSEVGKGATFYFTIPRSLSKAAPATATAGEEQVKEERNGI